MAWFTLCSVSMPLLFYYYYLAAVVQWLRASNIYQQICKSTTCDVGTSPAGSISRDLNSLKTPLLIILNH